MARRPGTARGKVALALTLAIHLALGAAGCDRSSDEAGRQTTATTPKPPLPAPDNLLAQFVVAHPGTLLPELRRAMLSAVGQGHYWAATGLSTVDTLRQLRAPTPSSTLAGRPAIRAALDRCKGPAWLAILLDAQAAHACHLGKPGGGIAAPITLVAGPSSEGGLRLHIEVARPLLRVAAQALAGP